MKNKPYKLSRRSLFQGAAAMAGSFAAARLTGSSFLGEAFAATADGFAAGKRHVLIINLLGGFNALFPSAGSFQGAGTFGVTAGNVKQIAPNYSVDATTFGTLSQFLLDHSAAVGVRHGISAHGAAEAAVMSDN